jgi:hypothetical protein
MAVSVSILIIQNIFLILVLAVIAFYVHCACGSFKLHVHLINVSEKLGLMNGSAFALFVDILMCSFFIFVHRC